MKTKLFFALGCVVGLAPHKMPLSASPSQQSLQHSSASIVRPQPPAKQVPKRGPSTRTKPRRENKATSNS